MDEVDHKLLCILQKNARTPVSEISKILGKARTTIQFRIEKLENSGVIAGYSITLGKQKPFFVIEATVLLRSEPSKTLNIIRSLNAMQQVEKTITTSGRYDILLEVQEVNLQELDGLLEQIGQIEGVRDSESLIHLRSKLR